MTTYKVATYAVAGAFYALSGILLAGYLRVPSLWSETAICCRRSRSWCSAERRCWAAPAASPPRRSARSFWSSSSKSHRHGSARICAIRNSGGNHLARHVAARRAMASACRCDPRRASGRSRGAKRQPTPRQELIPSPESRCGFGNGPVQAEPTGSKMRRNTCIGRGTRQRRSRSLWP